MSQYLSVAAIQHSCTGDRDKNLATTIQGIRDAAKQGTNLIVLQELHTSLYFCQTEDPELFDLSEAIPGSTTDQLSTIAAELNIVIVASIFERRAAGIYHNTAVVLDTTQGIVGIYRKMHIPDDPGFHEKYYFTPGDLGFQPIDTSVGRLGVQVCWDQWYPESARLMALAGAELLIYPTAIGWDLADNHEEQQRQLNAWMTIQRAHAIANGIPVISCNRCGFEGDASGITQGIQFWGNSFIAGSQGEIIKAAPADQCAVLTAEIDLSRTEQVRRIWPYFRDRRIDAYNGLLSRYLD
ncbi:MAG: carbon-nitrogen hydrolase [Gammaproteobacteria bacterium]|nr:carbon-nitrogen hydrolase [Gammaproteobacteria bacterium]